MKKRILVILLFLSTLLTFGAETEYTKQNEINELIQTGIYYYWHGGDLKKVENDFFKGITLKGKYDVVEESFKKASLLNPERLDLKFGVASTKIIQGKTVDAIEKYKEISKQDKDNFDSRILTLMYSKVLDDKSIYDSTLTGLNKKFPDKTKEFMEKNRECR